jgi:hypothetical protein
MIQPGSDNAELKEKKFLRSQIAESPRNQGYKETKRQKSEVKYRLTTPTFALPYFSSSKKTLCDSYALQRQNAHSALPTLQHGLSNHLDP